MTSEEEDMEVDIEEEVRFMRDGTFNINGVKQLSDYTKSMLVDQIEHLPSNSLSEKIFIVIDTNVFIRDLHVVYDLKEKSFKKKLEINFVIPWIVLQELDNLKGGNFHKKNKLQDKTTACIKCIHKWLIARDPKIIGQKPLDIIQENEFFPILNNDDRILHCCLQIEKKYNYRHQVFLITNDKSLQSKAIVNNILPFGIMDFIIHLEQKLGFNFYKQKSSYSYIKKDIEYFDKAIIKTSIEGSLLNRYNSKETYNFASDKLSMINNQLKPNVETFYQTELYKEMLNEPPVNHIISKKSDSINSSLNSMEYEEINNISNNDSCIKTFQKKIYTLETQPKLQISPETVSSSLFTNNALTFSKISNCNIQLNKDKKLRIASTLRKNVEKKSYSHLLNSKIDKEIQFTSKSLPKTKSKTKFIKNCERNNICFLSKTPKPTKKPSNTKIINSETLAKQNYISSNNKQINNLSMVNSESSSISLNQKNEITKKDKQKTLNKDGSNDKIKINSNNKKLALDNKNLHSSIVLKKDCEISINNTNSSNKPNKNLALKRKLTLSEDKFDLLVKNLKSKLYDLFSLILKTEIKTKCSSIWENWIEPYDLMGLLNCINKYWLDVFCQMWIKNSHDNLNYCLLLIPTLNEKNCKLFMKNLCQLLVDFNPSKENNQLYVPLIKSTKHAVLDLNTFFDKKRFC